MELKEKKPIKAFSHVDASHAKLCNLPSRLEMVPNTFYLLYPLRTGPVLTWH